MTPRRAASLASLVLTVGLACACSSTGPSQTASDLIVTRAAHFFNLM
ncbi:MAG TPA: hypothetical protein VGK94_08885 [Candidatus Polarisedimenticolia bacterium]|jgi:hypothetical protein